MTLKAIALTLALLPVPAVAESVDILIEEAVYSEFGSEMPLHGEITVRLPSGAIEEADFISQFWMDKQSGHFIAMLITKDGGGVRVEGLAGIDVPVAVPVETMMPGAIVSLANLEVVRMPHNALGAFAVPDPEMLVGMEVRRVLRKGRPIMQQSVITPVAIARGDKVTLFFDRGGLRLTAPGRALSNAHLDEDVRVINQSSNQTVTGIAGLNGLVEVLN